MLLRVILSRSKFLNPTRCRSRIGAGPRRALITAAMARRARRRGHDARAHGDSILRALHCRCFAFALALSLLDTTNTWAVDTLTHAGSSSPPPLQPTDQPA